MHALAAALGWQLVTPPKTNRIKSWPFNRAAYRARSGNGRDFGRIKRLRGIANCYHKLAHVCPNQFCNLLHPHCASYAPRDARRTPNGAGLQIQRHCQLEGSCP